MAGKSLGRTCPGAGRAQAGSCTHGSAGGLGCVSSSWDFSGIAGRNLKRHGTLSLWEPPLSRFPRARLAACAPAPAHRQAVWQEDQVSSQEASRHQYEHLVPAKGKVSLARQQGHAVPLHPQPRRSALEAHLARPASLGFARSPSFATCLARETLR